LPIILLMLFVLSFSAPFVALAQTTATRQCPTYLTNLLVDYVNSNLHTVVVGDTVITTFHVVYPDGTPVTLSPETASFSWVSSLGQKIFENVPVVPTGVPGSGYYNYTETVTNDFPTGEVTISVLFCCLSDGLGNYGSTDDVSSITTLTTTDDSIVNIGPPGPPTLPELLATYAIPIVIAALLIIALLLLIARSRKKKTST